MEDYRVIPTKQGRLLYVPVLVAPAPAGKPGHRFVAYFPAVPLALGVDLDQDPIVSEED